MFNLHIAISLDPWSLWTCLKYKYLLVHRSIPQILSVIGSCSVHLSWCLVWHFLWVRVCSSRVNSEITYVRQTFVKSRVVCMLSVGVTVYVSCDQMTFFQVFVFWKWRKLMTISPLVCFIFDLLSDMTLSIMRPWNEVLDFASRSVYCV